MLEGKDGVVHSFMPQASLMGSGTELGVRACLLDEDAAFLTLADMKSLSRETLAAHPYKLNLGKLFEFTSSLLHFYLETGSRKAHLFNPHGSDLAIRFCIKKRFLNIV